jgi:PAS domain S-box-containing protein
MTKKVSDLRKRAEDAMWGKHGDLQKLSVKDAKSLIHELQVHQIELEMQNEELLRAQTELEASRNRFSDLYDFAPVGYFTFDKNGLIIEVNLTAANKLGVERNFLIKKPFSVFLSPDSKDTFYLHLQHVFRTGVRQTCELKLEDKEGVQLDVQLESLSVQDGEGNSSQCRATISDITERKRIEEEIYIALTHAESIIDTIREPLVVLDSNMHMRMANHAFFKTFKVSIEDIKDKSFCEIGSCQWDISKVQELFQEIIPGFDNFLDYEIECEFPDIGRRIMVLNGRRIFRESIGKQLILISLEDITERKKIEEILLENERLISATEARSEFLTIMSHELRTPLTSIIGYSIILQGMGLGKLNQKQGFLVDNILESSKHLLDLINNFLDLAKIEAGKMELVVEEIFVPDTINEILKLVKENAVKHNIILKTEFYPELKSVMADRRAFKQILFNLLSNAIKFSKNEGGIITVSIIREDDMVKISVSDTGIGIKEEEIPRLFQKFEQLDSGMTRKYEGTGLGLAITKQLVDLHGGKIWIESKYGEGSTISFLLPIRGNK